jgi:DEAD/DEAH box helicase domain-containing protein
MQADQRVAALLADPAFAPYIVESRLLPARDGRYAPFPADLDPRLAAGLAARGIDRLYTHQAAAWAAARSGRHSVVVTPTASGKTLCYNLPGLQALLESPTARALYLFPTKALSQDQQAELNEIILGGRLPVKVCTYDGDTPDSLRAAARDSGRIVVSNPDMLHAGILPNHPKWIKFFSDLRYVVVDEAHTYRGVFGSHVANVLRRLKRIAGFYGARPTFILCSATIGNPRELAEQLIEAPVELIDDNGAPRGAKRVVLYNPPLVDAVQGIRRSVMTESQRWALAFLRAGVKTILFAHSRVRTEVVASYVNESLANINTDNERIRVEAYRGGLLPNERREIERGLRDGSVQGVVSTNALELGIDIGGLDAAVVAGFPGSFNSFWQQTGRAGRRGGESIAVFVASASPLDQYVVRHPEWFFGRPAEAARLDADNPYILTDQLKCAAFELPFGADERFGTDAQAVLAFLEADGVVRRTGGKWYWSDRSYPAEAISLRSASADNVVIIDATAGRNAVIGEMDRPGAKELIFKNAVYLHRGRQYLVRELDIANRRCEVEEADVNYFTDALVKTDIKPLTEDEEFDFADASGAPLARAVLGDVLVRSQVAKFKKIRFHTHENIGYGEIDLPEEETQTRALTFLFPPGTAAGARLAAWDEARIGAALGGFGSLVKRIAPLFLLCDGRDLGVAERARDPHFGLPAVYVYDRYPGGTGLAEALALSAPDLFRRCLVAVRECDCAAGCPACVGADAAVIDFDAQDADGYTGGDTADEAAPAETAATPKAAVLEFLAAFGESV